MPHRFATGAPAPGLLSVEREMALGLGAPSLVLILVACATLWSLHHFQNSHLASRRSAEIIATLNAAAALTWEIQAAPPEARAASAPLWEHLASTSDHLRTWLAREPADAAQWAILERQLAEARGVAGDPTALERLRATFRELQSVQRSRLALATLQAQRTGRLAALAVLAGLALCVLLIVFAAVLLRREIGHRRAVEAARQESEELYNRSPCGYESLDAHGVFREINDTALGWLGYRRDEVVGRMRFVDLLPPSAHELFAQRFAALKRDGSAQNLEFEWRRKDGTLLPILLSTRAVYDAQGQFLATRATIFDISARKRMEQERDRFFTLARDLLCITDFEGRFLRVNPAWTQVLGYTAEELMAEPFIFFVHPEDRERSLAEASRIVAGLESLDFENRYRCKDGSYRCLSWRIRAVPEERLVFSSARDVTATAAAEAHIRKLNADLASRAEQLETANRELESFSYSVSHDLRAPLRHIDGFAHLLTKRAAGVLDEQGRRYVDIISKSAKQMGLLIDDLLAFSRIGRTPLRLESVAHDRLVAEVIAEGRYAEGGHLIAWAIAPLPDVHADRALLRQVWHNLIDNAVKYSGKHPAPRIQIGSHADERTREHVFFVRDNGVGFDMKYVDKLFGVFQRLHGPTEFDGTGIGLANVRRVITRHGGRTWAEGRVDEGATFYFSLPSSSPPPAPHVHATPDPAGRG